MEKVIEIVEGDDDVTLIIRPIFPFAAENFALNGQNLAIIGPSSRIVLRVDEDQIGLIKDADRLLLVEYASTGTEPHRELIITRV